MAHIPRLYLSEEELSAGRDLLLSADQSKRLAETMRVQVGDSLLLFTGDGSEWAATVVSARRGAVAVEATSITRTELPPQPAIELCFPLIRPNRLDWMVEKATECGVDAFRPVKLAHSARGEELSPTRVERWRRIAIEAAEQSSRLTLPQILPITGLTGLLSSGASLIVADAAGSPWTDLRDTALSAPRLLVLVGPEGGLTASELAEASAAGARLMRLGGTVLRTETAAVVATAMLASLRR